jgi:hypothetical protein
MEHTTGDLVLQQAKIVPQRNTSLISRMDRAFWDIRFLL